MVCNFPNEENLQGFQISADYNGHGTSAADVILVAIFPATIAIAAIIIFSAMFYFDYKTAKINKGRM